MFSKASYGDEWTFFKCYRDTETGTHMNRPGLEEMLYDAESGLFDTLLVFRVDRLSRKLRELAQMVDELDKYSVVFKSITEPFDTATAAGRMMLQMLGVFAEFEHATIVERTRVGMEKKAKSGEWVGGQTPYGYERDPDKGLVVKEEEAVVVKKMFRMYAFGREGAYTISKKLNDAGYRKRSGRKWDKRVVLHMLKNPLYIGKVRWREVIYEGNHDAVVSEEIFNQVRQVLDERAEEGKGRQWHNGDERLLTGIMRCAKCKSHMFGAGGNKDGKQVPYYVCSKRYTQHECDQDYIRAERLEAAIVQDIREMLGDEQFMARIWEEANRRLDAEKPDIDKEISRVESKMQKVRAAMERYFAAFEEGKLKPELCNEKIEDLNSRLEELEGEKRDLEERCKRLELPAIDSEMLAGFLQHFDEVMTKGTNPQKKDLIRRLVKRVNVHDRRTTEVWYCLPNCGNIENWHMKLPGEDSNLQPCG